MVKGVKLGWTIGCVLLAAGTVGSARATEKADAPLPDVVRLKAMAARFAPVPIGARLSLLPPSERRTLDKLVEAARVMDALFLRQVWAGNPTLLLSLLRDESPLGRARLRYFLLNSGPWSRLDGNAAFIPGVPARPPAANYYPPGATKEEVVAWMDKLSGADRARASGYFTTIRRAADGTFRAVPYGLEYQDELGRAAALLREAAATTVQPSLRLYLTRRAEAFLSDDYYASDLAWMELDASIEPTIGPYETYEDEWFGAKAAFEAFIALRDDGETARLTRFSACLQDLEDHLPIEPAHRNPKLGTLAPIRVVNVVFTAGNAGRAAQAAAFNLPNDERIVKEKGAKRVMIKNVQQAKFDKILLPIAAVALPAEARGRVVFDAFFTHTLMHELMHGLGPHNIQIGGGSTVRQELKETYSALEEAKADISGLWALQRLVDNGVVDKSLSATMYPTFLADVFRC